MVSVDEKTRWDQRYASGEYQPRWEPSPLVEQVIGYLGAGRALVIACGAGRNALRLAEAGFDVTGIDISSVAIEMARAEAEIRHLEVEWKAGDIEEMSLSPEYYDLVTMVRYVNRAVWPRVSRALAPGGWLLMEQHLETHLDVIGPSAGYRVAPGELLQAFPDLRVVYYTESVEPSDRSEGLVASARLLACKGDPGW